MEKYQVIEKAGSGNFSDVYKAIVLGTPQEVVAIKEMKKMDDIEELVVRELQILASLDHPNIIKVRQVIRTNNNQDVRVVFEYMEENLLELYTTSKYGINENQLRCILYQTAFALEYLHRRHIIHRDIKPQNILINRKTALIKLIDFGLAKDDYTATTDYVATRWYRSPQNLIGLRKSTTALDIFSLACVAVELFNLNPLFPGNDTIDQLHKIFSVLGTPTQETWPQGFKELHNKNISVPHQPRVDMGRVVAGASPQFIDLLDKMLQLNPEHRITAREMLQHPFFREVQKFIPVQIYEAVEKFKRQNIFQINHPRKLSSANINSRGGLAPETNGYHSSPAKLDAPPNSRFDLQNQQSLLSRSTLISNTSTNQGVVTPSKPLLNPNTVSQANIGALAYLNSNQSRASLPNQNNIANIMNLPLVKYSSAITINPQKNNNNSMSHPNIDACSRISIKRDAVAPTSSSSQPSVVNAPHINNGNVNLSQTHSFTVTPEVQAQQNRGSAQFYNIVQQQVPTDIRQNHFALQHARRQLEQSYLPVPQTAVPSQQYSRVVPNNLIAFQTLQKGPVAQPGIHPSQVERQNPQQSRLRYHRSEPKFTTRPSFMHIKTENTQTTPQQQVSAEPQKLSFYQPPKKTAVAFKNNKILVSNNLQQKIPLPQQIPRNESSIYAKPSQLLTANHNSTLATIPQSSFSIGHTTYLNNNSLKSAAAYPANLNILNNSREKIQEGQKLKPLLYSAKMEPGFLNLHNSLPNTERKPPFTREPLVTNSSSINFTLSTPHNQNQLANTQGPPKILAEKVPAQPVRQYNNIKYSQQVPTFTRLNRNLSQVDGATNFSTKPNNHTLQKNNNHNQIVIEDQNRAAFVNRSTVPEANGPIAKTRSHTNSVVLNNLAYRQQANNLSHLSFGMLSPSYSRNHSLEKPNNYFNV